jgi:2-dehydro-3-deoxygluconokinase
MTPRPFDLIALGEALIEFNQRDPAQPLFQMGFGGDTSNAVIAAARLGARCAYLTQVGDDSFGEALLALWQREGVATDGVRSVRGAPTGLYFVSHGARGHEFTYRRAGSAASLMTPAQLPRELIAATAQLHVSGISLAISDSACESAFEAMRIARAAGARISFDLNHRPRLWSAARALELTRRVLADCDLFLPSVDEIALLTGIETPQAIIDWAHGQGARAVVLKLGAMGCIVSDGRDVTALPPMRVTPVDATGAGDCFAGACLGLLARGASLVDAARIANIAAALSTQGFGAVDPLPRWAQIQPLLAQMPIGNTAG